MALTPPGDRHGSGLYIASKGRCSVIVDTDGDDVADREVEVAEGWKAITHAIDALGVAVAKDGSVYFGIGCEDFTNAYLLDKTGKAHYDLKGDRGTIQRVSPDFQTRETVATGVRFPVALAFNRRGDLFATDQEGATWLSNGNPFDELLADPSVEGTADSPGIRNISTPSSTNLRCSTTARSTNRPAASPSMNR